MSQQQKKRKLTDSSRIPDSLSDRPEVQLLHQLVDLENKIDVCLSERVPSVVETLNFPLQEVKPLLIQAELSVSESGYYVKVFNRLCGSDVHSNLFLDRVVVKSDGVVYEWGRRVFEEVCHAGIEIPKHEDSSDVEVVVFPHYDPPHFGILDPDLCKALEVVGLGGSVNTKGNIIAAFYDYTTQKKLRTVDGSFKCDALLKKVLLQDEMTFMDLLQLLPLLTCPPKPVILVLRPPSVVKVEVLIDMVLPSSDAVARQAWLRDPAAHKRLQTLNDEIDSLLTELGESTLRRNMFLRLAKDPAASLESLIIGKYLEVTGKGKEKIDHPFTSDFYFRDDAKNILISCLRSAPSGRKKK